MSSFVAEHVAPIVRMVSQLTSFEPADGERIHQHRDLLLSWIDEIVQAFYDRVFSCAESAAIFHSDERPAREKTLAAWLVRTFSEPIDEDYWAWQWYVGLIHIKRRVSNPMMISMMAQIQTLVDRKAIAALGTEEGMALASSLHKVNAIVTALVSEGYTIGSMEAIARSTGMSIDLVKINIDTVIDDQLASAGEQLHRGAAN